MLENTIQTNQTSGLKTKGNYGRLNDKILIEAIGGGLSKVASGRLAGSKAKRDENVIQAVNNKLASNSNIKRSIIDKLEALQHQILDSIKPNEVFKTPFTQRMVAFGITTDKAQLLKGDPTSRIELMPKMVLKEDEVSFETGAEIEKKEIPQKLTSPEQKKED